MLNEIQIKTIKDSVLMVDNFNETKSYTPHEIDILRFAETIKTLIALGQQYEELIDKLKQLVKEGQSYQMKYQTLVDLIELKVDVEKYVKLKPAVEIKDGGNEAQGTEGTSSDAAPKRRKRRTKKIKLTNVQLTDSEGEREGVQSETEIEQHEDRTPIEEPEEAGETQQ